MAVALCTPRLFQYFVDDEVVNHITANEVHRQGEWQGWAAVYVPTLLLCTLPWTPALMHWSATLPGLIRWRRAAPCACTDEAGWMLLTTWLLLSLLVFCLARSRRPLYLLPLFVPLALVAAMQRARGGL